MKRVKTYLTILLWAALLVAACLVVIFESETAEPGCLAGMNEQTEFIITSIMEMLTLACIPLALKLFKFKRVHRELLADKYKGLKLWGTVRLGLLLLPMVVNTLLYYMYMNTAFGYMAIILVLCVPFVYPSMSRCQSETEEEKAEKGESENERMSN